jgi:hypothetical protein
MSGIRPEGYDSDTDEKCLRYGPVKTVVIDGLTVLYRGITPLSPDRLHRDTRNPVSNPLEDRDAAFWQVIGRAVDGSDGYEVLEGRLWHHVKKWFTTKFPRKSIVNL